MFLLRMGEGRIGGSEGLYCLLDLLLLLDLCLSLCLVEEDVIISERCSGHMRAMMCENIYIMWKPMPVSSPAAGASYKTEGP